MVSVILLSMLKMLLSILSVISIWCEATTEWGSELKSDLLDTIDWDKKQFVDFDDGKYIHYALIHLTGLITLVLFM